MKCLLAVACLDQLVAFIGKNRSERIEDLLLIVNYEYPSLIHNPQILALWRSASSNP